MFVTTVALLWTFYAFGWRVPIDTKVRPEAKTYPYGFRHPWLRVGVANPGAPFVSGALEHPDGYDADFVREVSRYLGFTQVRWTRVARGALSAPGPRPFDIGVHVVLMDEGSKVLEASRPYFALYKALLMRRGSMAGAVRDDPAKARNLVLGTATQIAFHPQHRGNLHKFASLRLGLAALSSGSIDALIISAPRLPAIERAQPGVFDAIGIYPAYKDVVFSIPRGAPLLDAVNRTLAVFDANGTHTRLVLKWFPQARYLLRLPGTP
jgi:ABC-type amino acid transport substrate-binding protein